MRYAVLLAGLMALASVTPAVAEAEDEVWCGGFVDYLDSATRLNLEGEIGELVRDGCLGYLATSQPPEVSASLASGNSAGISDVTEFVGNGYSFLVPDLGWGYSRGSGGDTWTGASDDVSFGLAVMPVTNLLSIEQSLEGARDRLLQGFGNFGASVASAEPVVLPSGAAYKIVATSDAGPAVGYAFYRGGMAVGLTAIGLDEALVDAIAESFRWG